MAELLRLISGVVARSRFEVVHFAAAEKREQKVPLRRTVGVLPLVPEAPEQAPTVEYDDDFGTLGRAEPLIILVQAALPSSILCTIVTRKREGMTEKSASIECSQVLVWTLCCCTTVCQVEAMFLPNPPWPRAKCGWEHMEDEADIIRKATTVIRGYCRVCIVAVLRAARRQQLGEIF